MSLANQDIVVLLKIAVNPNEKWTSNSIASDLGLSPSQVHYSIQRCLKARLMHSVHDQPQPILKNVEEFMIHAVKYFCIPQNGAPTRGMPTIWAAAPLKDSFSVDSNSLPPVWPDPEGTVKGYSFQPIHKSAIIGSKNDNTLYEVLVLVDAIRDGSAREKNQAIKILKQKLKELK